MTRPHRKKSAARKATRQRGKAKQKRVKKTALVAPVKQNWGDPVWFLMLVIMAIPVLGPTPQVQGLPGVIRLSFLLPVLPLLLVYIGYRKSAITISLQPAMLALWGVVLLAVLTSFWAINSYGAITGIIKWVCVLMMSIAVYSVARDADTHRKIMIACALAGGYMALIGVTQYLTGHEIYRTPQGEYPWPSATSGHKNMASQFVVMTLPFALYLSLTARKKIGYWLANPLIGLMLAYIVYGRARQVFVALFVQILIMLAAISFTRSRQLLAPRSLTKDYFFSIIASLILFVSLALAPPFDKPFSWEQSAVSEFASRTEVFTKQDATLQEISNGRYATWVKSASMIRNHPAGVGLNNWTVHFPRYNAEAGEYYYQSLGNDVWEDAHNDYLQILAELGLISLLLAGLLMLGLWKIYRLIWTQGDETSQRHSLFFGMGLMALFTVMMFSFPLQRTAQPVYLGIFLAMISAMASLSLSSKAEKQVAFRPAVFTVLLLLSIVSTYFGYREISGWKHAFLARALGERVFQAGENNPYATRRIMLALAKLTEKSMELEPYAPRLLTDYIITYNFLAMQIDHDRLADEYRNKSFDIAKRYLASSPYDGHIHKIVATSLQVPNETAMEHIGKAIALDPGNLQLYEYLRGIAFPAEKFAQALTYYEYYIPRFYNQKMNEEYAYIGRRAKQEGRVINTLAGFDLTRKFTAGSAEYNAARKRLDQLVDELREAQESPGS